VKTETLTVTGMKCAGCKAAVQSALQQLEGVDRVQAELSGGRVTVIYDASRTDLAKIRSVISGAGFSVQR